MKKAIKSCIAKEMYKCLICGSYRNIEIHHIFDGNNKEDSAKYGLIVPLCRYHHTDSSIAVHNKNGSKLDLELKKLGQKAFEWKYTREEFIERFGENYLCEETFTKDQSMQNTKIQK